MSKILAMLVLAVPAIASAQAPEPEPPPPAEPAPSPPEPTPPPPSPADPVGACKRDIAERASKLDDAQERDRLLATTPDCDRLAARANPPPPAPVAPPAIAATPALAHADGFAFGAELELAPTLLSDTVFAAMPQTHVLIGYQTGPLTLGVTLDVERVSVSDTPMGAPAVDRSVTTVLVGPAVRIAVARSESGATELLATGDFAYRAFDLSASDAMGPSDLGHIIVAHLGPSIRHWIGPHFALAATAAARIDDFAPPGSSMASSSYAVSLGTSFQMLGVF